jgi:hypothetical protein
MQLRIIIQVPLLLGDVAREAENGGKPQAQA